MKCLSLTILVWGLFVANLVAQTSTTTSRALLNRASSNALSNPIAPRQFLSNSTTTAGPIGTNRFNTGILPVVSFTTINVSCNTATDGCATAVVSGNTGNLGYLWSNGATTSTICGLGAGFYRVTVTDTIPVGSPTLDTVYFENFEGTHNWNLATSTGINGTDPNVWEVNDSEGGVAPTGCGVANNGDNTMHITCSSPLCGTLITGALYNATEESNIRTESPVFSTVGYNGITFTFDYIANGDSLNDNASLLYNDGSGWQVLDPSLKSAICTSGQGEWTAYSVTLPASCDNNPTVQIAFNWTNNADNIGSDPSIAINNTLLTSMGTSTAIQICTVVNDTTVIEPATLATSVDTVGHVICDGNSNGFINISVSGGTAPISYIWSNGDTTQDVSNLVDSIYSVTITDANACITVGGAMVNTLGFIEAEVDSAMNIVGCTGDTTGAIYITATGDTTIVGCSSNVVALNEILYKPILRNGQDPYTGEYIELIGPPGADISCYVLTDGDFTITIPQGTMIPPDGLFTIGNDSVWGAGTFDLDAENCNCFTEGTAGTALLILTDGGEYVALYDGAGTFLEGVIYSSPSAGNTPNGNVVPTLGMAGCPTSVTIPPVAAFETAGGGFASGTSIIRSPDGSGAWIPQVGGSLNACNVSGGNTGNGSVTYLWSNGATTQDLSNLSAGTYTVTATNTYGCTASTSYTLTEPALLMATTLATPSACTGDTTGMIDLTVTGGTMPYSFNWSNGATTEDIDMLSTGNYCVTVTDSSGCMAIVCDTIADPFFTIPVDTFYICLGDSVQIQVNTNATNIQWTPSASLSNDTISNPFASPTNTTTYTVTAFTSTTVNNLVVNGDFEAGNTGFTSTYSYGGGMGGAYVIDTNAYTHNTFHRGFDHTTGAGNFLIADAPAGSVDVWCQTVMVAPNTDYDFSVWANNIVRPTSNYDDPNIELLINGTVVYSSGAIPENPNVWINCLATWNSGVNTTAALCIRAAGAIGSGHDFGLDDISFGAPVTSSCARIDSVVVIVDSVSVSLATVHPVCHGDSTGSITTTALVNNYTYLWNTGDTTANLTNLGAGTYVLTAASASCQDSVSVTLTQPALLVGTTLATNIACVGDTTGTIDLTVTGGTMPYSFNWSNGATTEDVAMLPTGNYCVTVTDSSGCMAIVCDTIADPFFTIPVDTFYICLGDSVQIQVNTNVNNLIWTPSATLSNDTIRNPFANPTNTTTYVVSTVGTACTTMDSVTVIVGSVTASLTTINPLCQGDTTGSILTTVVGSNYTYLWSTGDTTANLTNVGAGMYLVTISLGSCQDTMSATLTEPTAVALGLSSSTNPTCNGDSTGAIAITNTGGTMPYTYLWSNGATTQNLNNVLAGTYNLTLTDDNGCTSPLSVVLTEPSAISVSYSTTNVSCGGSNDGTASIAPIGGTPGYTYLWDVTANNQTTATATNLTSNTYSVTVTDLEGCVTEANGIFVNPGIPVDSTDVPLVVLTGLLDCDLNPIGALEINTSNSYTYLWSNGATSASVTALPAGTYSVTVSNGLGCTYVQTAAINSPFVPTINPFIVNAGLTTTTVTSGSVVDINGGNDQTSQGVTYNWTNPSGDVTIATPTAHATTAMSTLAGSYPLTLTATATDSTACQDTASVVLNVASVYMGMPNAFTPNGDGINDVYRPIGLNAEDVVTFRVYNRWGQIVYNGDDLENMGWDGRFQGVEQPTEVYLFILEYKLGANSETKAQKGEFTLVR